MKVLVTGSTGFVGNLLLPYLHQRKMLIYTIDRSKNPCTLISKSYSWDQIQELPDVDCVIHLAAKAHDLKNAAEKEYVEANVILTKTILDYFVNSNSNLFVYLSTIKVIGDEGNTPIQESQMPAPETVYARTKYEAEKLVNHASFKEFQKRYILRPSLIYGPNCKGNLKLLYKLIKHGIPYPLGQYRNERTYLSIDNLNFVLYKITQNELLEGTYNVADETSISTIELIQIIGSSLNRKVVIWHWNKRIVNMAFSIATLINFSINRSTLKKLTGNYLVNTMKLQKALDSPLPVETKIGILDTFKSFQE